MTMVVLALGIRTAIAGEGERIMNQLTRVEAGLPVSVDTAKLIRASVSDNTLKAYRHALKKLETWLGWSRS